MDSGRRYPTAGMSEVTEDSCRLPYSLSRHGELTAYDITTATFPKWEELDPLAVYSLNCSNGALSNLQSLSQFANLESLIVDGNQIKSCEALPAMPTLQVLSLNKNQIVALGSFLVQAVDKFPALKHLSLMGNPCCPSEVFGASRQDYERYFDQVSTTLPTLESLDSTRITRANAAVHDASIVVKVASEMLMSRFTEMMEEYRVRDPNNEEGKPLTYLKVKSALVAEFGAAAFVLKKEVINKAMRKGHTATPRQSTSSESAVGSPAPTDSVLSSWIDTTPEQEDLTPRLADSGEVLNVKVTRPNMQSVGFKVIGGSDRGYGGTFVLTVTSTSAAELRPGDRIIAVNGTGLLATTQAQSERILSKSDRVLVVTVLRPSRADWDRLLALFGPKPPSTYITASRRIATAPMVNLSTIMYLGVAHLKGECANFSGGEIVKCVLHKHPSDKFVGIRMAGSFELGGIFITQVQEGSIASGEEHIRPGCRVLEVSGRSLLYATQINARQLIQACTTEVVLVLQAVPADEWHAIKARVSADVASTLVTRANAIRERKDPDAPAHRQVMATAKQLYMEALEHDDLDPALKCQALSGLGRICPKSEWSSAVQYHKEEAVLCTELGYIEVAARALNFVGNAYRTGHQLNRAIEAYENELEVVKSAKDLTGQTRAWSSLGIAHGGKNDLQRAVECHSNALTTANQIQDRGAAARAHSNLGISYFQLKEYDQATKHHTARLKIAEGLGDIPGQCKALNNLKEVAAGQGKRADALRYWNQLQPLMAQLPGGAGRSQSRPQSRMPDGVNAPPAANVASERPYSVVQPKDDGGAAVKCIERVLSPSLPVETPPPATGRVANAATPASAPKWSSFIPETVPTEGSASMAQSRSEGSCEIPEDALMASAGSDANAKQVGGEAALLQPESRLQQVDCGVAVAPVFKIPSHSSWADHIPDDVVAADLVPVIESGDADDIPFSLSDDEDDDAVAPASMPAPAAHEYHRAAATSLEDFM